MFARSFLSIFVAENPNAIYWLSDPVFYDNLLVNYYRTGLSRSKADAINDYVLTLTENSLYHYNFDFSIIQMEGKFINLKIFSDLSEFIEKNTVFNSLTLNSLNTSFRALFVCELLIFLLFLWYALLSPKKPRRAFRGPRKPYSLHYKRSWAQAKAKSLAKTLF